ncbi:MAG: XrtA/PEP-CTERM system histidine kinase PrsK [Nitrospirota bacterium]
MLQNILSIGAIAVLTGYAVYRALRIERSLTTSSLCTALLATAVLESCDLLSFIYPEQFLFWKKGALFSETVLLPAWLLFSLTFSRESGTRSIPITQRLLLCSAPALLVAAAIIPIEAFFSSPDFINERMLFLGNAGFIFYLGALMYMIAALFNLEVTLLTASRTSRWKIKFEVLGAGGLLAALLFYYSQGLLYRSLNMNLMPVRSIMAVVAVALMAYSHGKRGSGVRVYVSKQSAYRSAVIFIIGLYLIALGLMGEGMRYFGGYFQKAVLISLAFAGGMGLIAVLLSEKAQRALRIMLYKHFYANKYDYRMQWLTFTDRLSSAKTIDELLRAVLSGYRDTFGMEEAVLFLYDDGKKAYYNAASFGVSTGTESFSNQSPLVLQMKKRDWVLNINDGLSGAAAEDRTFFAERALSFAVPLYSATTLEVFIALGRPMNKNEVYTSEDYDLMKTFARHASSVLLNLKLTNELSNAREMEAMGKVSAFVMHDLKNLVTTLSLVIDNAREYMGDPDFQKDMLQSLSATMDKMKRLIARLKNLEEKQSLHRELVDVCRIAYETVGRITQGEVRLNISSVFSYVDVDELQKVILNLVLNAFEASEGKTPVIVEVGSNETAFIRVKDSGCGMTDEFMRERLFKPFCTTKKKGLGIGLYQCKHIVEAHGGWIEVTSEIGKGSVFTVHLPLAHAPDLALQCT